MRKFLISFLAVCTLMILAACGGSTSKGGANGNGEDSTASVAPAKKDHMFFMDLELGGDAKQFIATLQQRGFTEGSGFSDDENMVFLKGEVYGEMSELTIDTKGGKVNSVIIGSDLDANYTEKQAARRSKDLMDKLAEQYNKEWETICEGYYKLELPYGKADCSYGSECANGYSVDVSIVDSADSGQ